MLITPLLTSSFLQFFIKGVDYQPGGSSGVSSENDPLSDIEKCSRDIYLFQNLGINTIRVYSINPDLDHDKCMSLLAEAGMYLVLDVNSPMEHQHLNRYEPWSTYNEQYMSHVFKVVTQFSAYNNTLAFFAGNEVVNDRVSAKVSPVYIKAVIRDMKDFMRRNSMRKVPVGYSAADDLDYRISLAQYLACYDTSTDDQVDFYGVNTYQWCGQQTFYSSGYDTLVRDYIRYPKPIFFSEYGCNKILPRLFQEVASIYSAKMADVFSGGLVYEFAQEPNNYGLVDYDEDGNVRLLPDYYTFKKRLAKVRDPMLNKPDSRMKGFGSFGSKRTAPTTQKPRICLQQYENIDVSRGLPRPVARGIQRSNKGTKRAGFVALSKTDYVSKYKIFNVDGSLLVANPTVAIAQENDDDSDPVGRHYIWSSKATNIATPAIIAMATCIVVMLLTR